MNIRTLIASIAGVFMMLVFGCCTTVKNDIYAEAFVVSNQPPREIRVLVFYDGHVTEQQISEVLGKTASSLNEQVGITLLYDVILPSMCMRGHADYPDGAVTRLVECYNEFQTTNNIGDEFDLIISFQIGSVVSDVVGDLFRNVLIPTWEGVIDDTWRRYITLRTTDPWVVLHEIFHAFILEYDHSMCGIMAPVQLQILPGVGIKSRYLSQADRREVLKNKFRVFRNIEGPK